MERLTIDDMIKALRCVASQDTEGDCYKDHENFKHMEDDKYKRIVCGYQWEGSDWLPIPPENVWDLLRRWRIVLVERCRRAVRRTEILQRLRRAGLACEAAV